ncbi:hypothetical protein PG993_013636 [Apiospora rasikravindrae]|uniref:Uncharacterized protein n=1 Tax=Apiospora rasikravindrae TaxID=990691 RepID=A0ABR1RQS6_9PEZI
MRGSITIPTESMAVYSIHGDHLAPNQLKPQGNNTTHAFGVHNWNLTSYAHAYSISGAGPLALVLLLLLQLLDLGADQFGDFALHLLGDLVGLDDVVLVEEAEPVNVQQALDAVDDDLEVGHGQAVELRHQLPQEHHQLVELTAVPALALALLVLGRDRLPRPAVEVARLALAFAAHPVDHGGVEGEPVDLGEPLVVGPGRRLALSTTTQALYFTL